MNMKYVSLVLLIVQNTSLVLTMRYSLVSSHYIASTAVAMTELLKLATCCIVLYCTTARYSLSRLVAMLHRYIIRSPRDVIRLFIPSILYTVQNNVLYYALRNLDAATYQVVYQLKILTTALFSLSLLGKRLSRVQWVALVLLALGVGLAQASVVKDDGDGENHAIGFLAILVACFTSGFSGVYFEKILKGSKTSLWVRNVQMSVTAFPLALANVMVSDLERVTEDGFFQGYTAVVWFVILLQGFGGLLVATVVKYADNILKGFAAAVSILLSCLFSFLFLQFLPTPVFVIGTCLVSYSVFLYSKYPPKQSLYSSLPRFVPTHSRKTPKDHPLHHRMNLNTGTWTK